jgi:hypothetical protein
MYVASPRNSEGNKDTARHRGLQRNISTVANRTTVLKFTSVLRVINQYGHEYPFDSVMGVACNVKGKALLTRARHIVLKH